MAAYGMIHQPATASMAQLLRLDGRTAVVTGAAQGVGRAIAARLAEAGSLVYVADLDAARAEATAAELAEAWQATVTGVRADVRSTSDVEALRDRAVQETGDLHVWVNNAGVFPPAHPVDATAETVRDILDVNVVGTHLGCQAAAQHMIAKRRGVIVNIASTAAFRGAGAYSASKWAVRGLTQGLAARLGPNGVRVVGVAPTAVTTPGMDDVLVNGGPKMQTVFDNLVNTIPLARLAEPDDIARVVLFLASDAASYVTGVTLPVDGGELAV